MYVCTKKNTVLTVVSTREFNSNQAKYFELAVNEEVYIERDNKMYFLMYKPIETQYNEQIILEPDNNLRRAITAEELLERIHGDIRRKFVSKCLFLKKLGGIRQAAFTLAASLGQCVDNIKSNNNIINFNIVRQ